MAQLAVDDAIREAERERYREARPAKVTRRARIGAPGFEPGTSASRTQRSTGLSHAPRVMRSPAPGAGAAPADAVGESADEERVTGFEPATSTLARLRSTN